MKTTTTTTTTTILFGLLVCMSSMLAPVVPRLLNDRRLEDMYFMFDLNATDDAAYLNATDDDAAYLNATDDAAYLNATDDATFDEDWPDSRNYGVDQTGSLAFGYDTAKFWWGYNVYDCQGIPSEYWVDVQYEVFPQCDKTWGTMLTQDCKNGVEQFTLEQMGNCFDATQCSDIGKSAAASISGTFCETSEEELYHAVDAWLPEKCRAHAETSCKSEAVNVIQDYTNKDYCTKVTTRSSLDHLDEIHYLCEQEVLRMEEAATLVYYEY